MKKITILTPVYNEESNIQIFYTNILNFFENYPNYNFHIFFTDNASTDDTLNNISNICMYDNRVSCISYIKNYGYERSIYSGICNVSDDTDALIFMDVDLEDPIYLLGSFIARYEEGHDFVYGIRKSRSESKVLSFFRTVFYRLTSIISGNSSSRNVGNFSLISRKVINILKSINDPEPYIRGILFSLNLKSIGIEYDRSARTFGISKFSYFRLIDFATLSLVNSLKSPALLPLRLSIFILIICFIFLIFYFSSKFLYGDNWPPGFATLITFSLTSIVINTFFFGLFGFYIIKIYKILEVHGITIISKKIN